MLPSRRVAVVVGVLSPHYTPLFPSHFHCSFPQAISNLQTTSPHTIAHYKTPHHSTTITKNQRPPSHCIRIPVNLNPLHSFRPLATPPCNTESNSNPPHNSPSHSTSIQLIPPHRHPPHATYNITPTPSEWQNTLLPSISQVQSDGVNFAR